MKHSYLFWLVFVFALELLVHGCEAFFMGVRLHEAIVSASRGRVSHGFVSRDDLFLRSGIRSLVCNVQPIGLPPTMTEESIQSPTPTKFSAILTKTLMLAYLGGMSLSLPLAILPSLVLHRLCLISKVRKEHLCLSSGQFCARLLLFIFPFCRIAVHAVPNATSPQPSIWVCNHVSALDFFVLLASDLKLRGPNKRPIKIVYWKQLEANPITKLFFRQCGFMPVQMSANKAGDENEYDVASFRDLLHRAKQAFSEGFDIAVAPEGQLNPSPENGLRRCFPGAYTLARMSQRPIQMMAIHGTHRLWHASEDIGMRVTGRDVEVRVYPPGRRYSSSAEFLATFQAVVGEFGTTGKDLDEEELTSWLNGTMWNSEKGKL
eukprot:Nitzschia sp. Nitz4//scaffold55_size114948//1916//3196//NITZ4_003877-RA/size114948-snap-gene-0.139-mRNA-1//1//CDS//3329554458//6918//frame0